MNEHILLVLVSLHFNPYFKQEYKIRDFVFPRLAIIFYFNVTKEKHDDKFCRFIVICSPSKEEKTMMNFVGLSSFIAHQKNRR
jgi:hypothetical protein